MLIPTDELILAAARARGHAIRDRMLAHAASQSGEPVFGARHFGTAVATRMREHRRIHAAASDLESHLDEAFEWLLAGPNPEPPLISLEVAPIDSSGSLCEALTARGLYPRRAQSMLAATPVANRAPLPAGMEVRPPRDDEIDAFMRTFIAGFSTRDPDWTEAEQQARLPEMTTEYCQPSFRLHLATIDGEPAGIGVLWLDPNSTDAFLSNGATVEKHRGRGVHGALIRARLQTALDAGATRVFVDTSVNSTAERSLVRNGFQLVTHLQKWSSRRGEDRAATSTAAGATGR